MRTWRATVLGEMCADIIIHQPKAVPVFGCPVWAADIEIRPGGSASYAARVLHNLGVQVHFNVALGEDDVAGLLVSRLRAQGLDVGGIHFIAEPSMKAVWSIGEKPVCAGCTSLPAYTDTILDSTPIKTDLIYLGGYALFPELWGSALSFLFKQARAQGALIVVDTQMLPVPSGRYLRQMLNPEVFTEIDVLLLNQDEAQAFTSCEETQVAAARLAELGPRSVVVKLGEQGSLIWNQGATTRVQAFKVETPDCVGAGDYFGAGLSYGLLRGWSIEQAALFASATASAGIRLHGHTQSGPTVEQIESILEHAIDQREE